MKPHHMLNYASCCIIHVFWKISVAPFPPHLSQCTQITNESFDIFLHNIIITHIPWNVCVYLSPDAIPEKLNTCDSFFFVPGAKYLPLTCSWWLHAVLYCQGRFILAFNYDCLNRHIWIKMPSQNDSQAWHKTHFCCGIFKYHTHSKVQINISEPPHFWSDAGISQCSLVSVAAAFIVRWFWDINHRPM